ncbi:hypothetical protein FCV25MIE_09796 [Fagus crenata]
MALERVRSNSHSSEQSGSNQVLFGVGSRAADVARGAGRHVLACARRALACAGLLLARVMRGGVVGVATGAWDLRWR